MVAASSLVIPVILLKITVVAVALMLNWSSPERKFF
jgi:hypothetical protein